MLYRVMFGLFENRAQAKLFRGVARTLINEADHQESEALMNDLLLDHASI